MAGVLPGLQAAAPTAELPAWLSYTSSATATVERVYTFATLLANGIPTFATTAVLETEYGTDILQLPVTVDASAVEGQNLGLFYTTAGGTASATVVRLVGGTQEVTLGPSFSALVDTSASVATSPRGASSSDPRTSATAVAPSTTSRTAASVAASSSSSAAVSAVRSSATLAPTPSSQSRPFSTSESSSTAPLSTTTLQSLSPSGASTKTAASVSSSRTDIAPVPSIRAPPTMSNFSSGLTPSQLAAAIASPICFFFAVMFALLLCCCFVRRKRRRRAQQRALAEEEGLLDPGGGPPMAEKPHERRVVSGGVLWEWVPRRAPSRVSGRSGRSVLSRLTGGLLGGGASRSRSRSNRSRQTATPKSSPLEGDGEKFFGAAGHTGAGGVSPNTASHEGSSLLSPETAQSSARSPQSNGSAYPALVAAVTSPGMASTGDSSAEATSPREGLSSTDHQRLGEPFADIDLTSPRVDFGGFEPLPFTNEEEHLRHSPPPTLPPIRPSGAFRLTKLYTEDGTDAGAYLPASPVSIGRQPRASTVSEHKTSGSMGLLHRANITLSEIWNGYEAASPVTEDERDAFPSLRDSCTADASAPPWLQRASEASAPPDAITAHTPPLTASAPSTPKSNRIVHGPSGGGGVKESPAPRTPSPRRKQERALSEGGWLSGRVAAYLAGESTDSHSSRESEEGIPAGLRQRPASNSSSGETADLTRTPESTLFLNDSRWRGRSARAPSPPPFTSFDLVDESPIAYDPPLERPPTRPLPPLPTTSRHSETTVSGSDSSYSRQFSDSASQSLPHGARLPRSFSSANRVDAVKRGPNRDSSESGVSVLGRIAASFGALRSKRSNSSSEWEHDARGDAPPWRRSDSGGLGAREISADSLTDPFPRRALISSLSPPPPSMPSPPSSRQAPPSLTPKARGSFGLRYSTSQPSLASPTRYSASEPFSSSFRVSRPGSVHEGRQYLDPFEDVSEAEV